MQVRARQVDLTRCAPNVARFATAGQVFATAGALYEVFAVAVFKGQALLQIIDDLKSPAWLPALLFEVAESTVPSDWVCNIFLSEPSLVIGPDFVAKDQSAYSRIVELESHEVELLWKRARPVRPDSSEDVR